MPMTDRASVLETVRDRVTPDGAEREHLETVVQTVLERAEAALPDHPAAEDVVHVGSTARGTWLSGDHDVDVFVRFDPATDRETLESAGLAIGHTVLPDGHEQFSEHPYVTGPVEGVDVDVVPCYRLESATDVRSAVDRTPFHDAYLQAHLDDSLTTEVRLLKAFLSGIGVYGSDLRTRGVGGYLAELLVLEYGSATDVLTAVADWPRPVHLDPEDHAATSFEDSVVVIDPTDPNRNVAAVCSERQIARLQHHARAFLDSPSLAPFEPDEIAPLERTGLEAHLERRGTTLLGLHTTVPDLVEDQLYPQMRKSRRGIVRALEDHGFAVNRSAVSEHEGAALFLFDCTVAVLPDIDRHVGPPIHVRPHAESFLERYEGDPAVYGPFIVGDRYVVERERTVTSARAFLESDALTAVGLGARLEEPISTAEVLEGAEIAGVLSTFGTDLRRFLEPEP